MEENCEMPTVNSDNTEIREILAETKTVAVIGLSPDESKDSHKVAKYLQNVGYKIFPVYPKGETILGEKVYRSLAEIEERVDMVDIFRKPAVVMSVVDECIKRGDVKTVWAQKGIINNEAGEKAIEYGMKFVQNHCTMVEHREAFRD
jgi:predicted CoA-binding protein